MFDTKKFGGKYTVRQVAILLGVKEHVARELFHSGKLQDDWSQHRMNRCYLVDHYRLRQFVKENPEYKLVELTEETWHEFLIAAQDYTLREISAASNILKRNSLILKDIADELNK